MVIFYIPFTKKMLQNRELVLEWISIALQLQITRFQVTSRNVDTSLVYASIRIGSTFIEKGAIFLISISCLSTTHFFAVVITREQSLLSYIYKTNNKLICMPKVIAYLHR